LSATRPLYVAEPPAQYLVRPPLVVDCSILAGLVFREPWEPLATERIQGKTLHAPYLLQVELGSVAAKKHRTGAIDIALEGMAQFENMNIQLHQVQPTATLALALQYKLSTYDAAYLWLAAELKCPLATFDEKLAKAALIHLSSLD
jgi:predicted nucleic acid-binding protein